MRSAIKTFLSVVIMAAIGVGFLLSAGMASAADTYGFEQTAQGTDLKALSLSQGTPQSLAEMIVTRVLFFVGTIFFLLILYAGISWMLAYGSTEKVNTAKTILETAVIGLLVITASYAISTYVFNRFAGSNSSGGATCSSVGGICKNECTSTEGPDFTAIGGCVESQMCCVPVSK